MSLLMDALKKAEKARQAKAEHEEKAILEGPAETQGFSLDPLDDAPVPPPMAQPSSGSSPPRPEDSGSFAYDPLAPDGSAPRDEDLDATALDESGVDYSGQPPADTGEMHPDDAIPPLSLVDDDVLTDDTSATLPSIKAAQASVDDYFDGTHSVSMSMEQVRAAMDDEDTAERRGRAAPEPSGPQAARTVFDAKTPPRPRAGANRAVGVVLLLLIVLGAGGGGFYYWKNFIDRPSLVTRGQGQPRPMPAPAATPAPEPAPPAPAPVAAPAPVPVPAPPAPAVAIAGLGAPSVSEVMDTDSTAGATVPLRGDLTPKKPEPEPVVETTESADAAREAELLASAMIGNPGDVVDNLARAIERAGAAGDTRLSGGIRIKKATRRDRTSERVTRAYSALQEGDVAAAEKAYRRVLSAEPRNRDAMLGLAAVAARGGQWNQAAAQYMQILTLNPRDSLAQAALIAMQDRGADLGENESRLKLLIANEPKAPHLHFGLGNLYASQSRWPQAQQAFFNAYRHDSANADYAFNLAVSLDHLGQRDAALQYYQRSLELADRSYASFENAAVLVRIRAMTNVQ